MRVPDRFALARRLAALGATTLAALLLPAAGAWAGVLTPESGGSPNADSIHSLYVFVLVLGAILFFGVGGLLLYTMRRFRARKGVVPVPIHGNTRLEIGWTVGAAALLVVIAVVTLIKLPSIENPPNSGAAGLPVTKNGAFVAAGASQRLPPNGRSLRVEVNGQQYLWRFTYADSDKNSLNNVFAYEQMTVPTDTTVTLTIHAQDVAHSWWIPQLGGKFDAIPGYSNFTWFKIHKPGIYRGQCAELCGRNHANMVARVRALPPAQYEAWYASQKAAITVADKLAANQRRSLDAQAAKIAEKAAGPQVAAAQPSGAAAQLALGKQLFVAGNPSTAAIACAGCHTLKAAGAAGVVGPNLDAVLKGRPPAYISTSILKPNAAIANGFGPNIMPGNYAKTLSKQQLAALVAFINSSVNGN